MNAARYMILAAAVLSGGALGAAGCGKVSSNQDTSAAGGSSVGSGNAGSGSAGGPSILGPGNPLADGGAVLADAGLRATVIATSPTGISGFAIDATNVYFTSAYTTNADGAYPLSNGVVSKCPLSGCTGSPTVLATSQNYPQEIAVNGSALYWFNENGLALMRCDLDCRDNAKPFFSLQQIEPLGFAVTADRVFFTRPYAGLVEECEAGGCDDAGVTLASGQLQPSDIATDGVDLAWTNLGMQETVGRKEVILTDGGVLSCPVGGCDAGVKQLSPFTSSDGCLAVANGTIYWCQGSSIVSCSAADCTGTPTMLVPDSGQPTTIGGLSVDADNIYFTSDSGSQYIASCPLTGCPNGPTVLATIPTNGPPATFHTAVDATHVYFVANYGTQILALTK